MKDIKLRSFIKDVLRNMPEDWLRLTTHRLDIYNESLAKVEFIEQFEILYHNNVSTKEALTALPTAYDYIRLGHPLSCVLEWVIAMERNINPENVISFASRTIPILAVLRKNSLENKSTHILYNDSLPNDFNPDVVRSVYGYEFSLERHERGKEIKKFDGSNLLVSPKESLLDFPKLENVDFHINTHSNYGSVILVADESSENYISEIQHVRRRESIAMTPNTCLSVLRSMVGEPVEKIQKNNTAKQEVVDRIKDITGTESEPLIGSSGLSIQYAIMMGLVHDALENHKGKAIKFVVPPNCYGGTNDQARRVAACKENVEIVDLLVDGENDMVQSLHRVLDKIAKEDAIPYIIAEIPTNPRVEVPDLSDLQQALMQVRVTSEGKKAIDPVFILDQTFCPNVKFLEEGAVLSSMRAISYSSGSKFPSGGLCNAGYCVGNQLTQGLMDKVDLHLKVCENEATELQMEILAEQLPSMLKRIRRAYDNTRDFVNFIKNELPDAKINFVSDELADQGFTPSVFSLDLATKGNTEEEREIYKRTLNHKLINLMITEIPSESKHCVSYGQLKGCYWTIPATSTQGTTKEKDKDYIARVALSPDMDMERHKEVFHKFVTEIA